MDSFMQKKKFETNQRILFPKQKTEQQNVFLKNEERKTDCTYKNCYQASLAQLREPTY